ncbi:hypothetical protein KDI_49660 [Dictyobacter arantiisoli]|uniref:Uncharacterized protein n=1 Tax=Dictyobacter arantiisoli TaxID=2014874 RepID=A0A5A5TJ86_9CHLR|nr:hypothetical protein KDI_49660 [Dictyobacter arantiisoli]
MLGNGPEFAGRWYGGQGAMTSKSVVKESSAKGATGSRSGREGRGVEGERVGPRTFW